MCGVCMCSIPGPSKSKKFISIKFGTVRRASSSYDAGRRDRAKGGVGGGGGVCGRDGEVWF
jgi:hypothetical protein